MPSITVKSTEKLTLEQEREIARYKISSLPPVEELFRRAAEIQRAAGLPERRKVISSRLRFLVHG